MLYAVIDTQTLNALVETVKRYQLLFKDQIIEKQNIEDDKNINLAKVALKEAYNEIVVVGTNANGICQSERFNVWKKRAIDLLNLESQNIQEKMQKEIALESATPKASTCSIIIGEGDE